jgi:hypothetical protein
MASNVNILPPHSKRVQAWVYAILNPVIDGLRRELLLLEKGNLTWRFYSRKCEYIRPLREYVDGVQMPNFEDFLADGNNASLKSEFDAHDSVVSEVEASATAFFDRLIHSDLFRRDVERAFVDYESNGDKPGHPYADQIKADLPKYVAEYLINQTNILPSHYLIHKFWEEFRDRFDRSKEEFEPFQGRETFQNLRRSSSTLRDLTQKFSRDIENHRYWLCSTYDIPAAPIPIDISHSGDIYVTRSR